MNHLIANSGSGSLAGNPHSHKERERQQWYEGNEQHEQTGARSCGQASPNDLCVCCGENGHERRVQGSRTATVLFVVGVDTCVLCAGEHMFEKLNKFNVVMINEELTQDDADVEDIW